MRIAYLTWHGKKVAFGADISIHRLAVMMASKGHDVHLFHTTSESSGMEKVDGVNMHSCHRGNLPLIGKMAALSSVMKAFSVENDRKPFDIVQINGPSLGLCSLMIGDAPVIYKDVDVASAKLKRGEGRGVLRNAIRIRALYAIESLAVRMAYTVFVSSKFSMDEFVARYPYCVNKILVVPPAGLGSEWFAERPASWESRKGKAVFLFIGAFQRRLADVFVRALKHLKDSGSEAYGIMVREENSEARELANKLGVEMEFHTNIPAATLRGYYSDSLAYILPSLREGFCIPLVEAGSVGTPSIVYDIPHIRDFISDGVNGSVLKDLDPENWAGEMKKMMIDSEYWSGLSKGAREKALVYRMDSIAENIENRYEADMSGWSGKSRKARRKSPMRSG